MIPREMGKEGGIRARPPDAHMCTPIQPLKERDEPRGAIHHFDKPEDVVPFGRGEGRFHV